MYSVFKSSFHVAQLIFIFSDVGMHSGRLVHQKRVIFIEFIRKLFKNNSPHRTVVYTQVPHDYHYSIFEEGNTLHLRISWQSKSWRIIKWALTKTYEARAELCQIFRSFFGQWSFKWKRFWDLLTFNGVKQKWNNCLHIFRKTSM